MMSKFADKEAKTFNAWVRLSVLAEPARLRVSGRFWVSGFGIRFRMSGLGFKVKGSGLGV